MYKNTAFLNGSVSVGLVNSIGCRRFPPSGCRRPIWNRSVHFNRCPITGTSTISAVKGYVCSVLHFLVLWNHETVRIKPTELMLHKLIRNSMSLDIQNMRKQWIFLIALLLCEKLCGLWLILGLRPIIMTLK